MFLLKLLLAVCAMAAALWLAAGDGQRWVAAGAIPRVVWLVGVVSLGGAVYFATLWLLGFRLRDFKRFEAS